MYSNWLLALLVEAVRAKHRTVAGGLEGNFGFVAALGAGHLEQLARSALGVLVVLTAIRATLGLILKALLLVEFLLAGSKGEWLAAIFTAQGLVRETHVSPWNCGFFVRRNKNPVLV